MNKSLCKLLSMLAATTLTWTTAYSSNVPGTTTGVVRGHILDTAHDPLPGAVILVKDLNTAVVSDVNGFYTLPNLGEGVHTVRVSYLGFNSVEVKVNVGSGRTTEKNITLKETETQLGEVVVTGAFQGQHKALNTQKNNLGVTDIVSAQQVGKFPDSNIGDALKRISGINVQYDQGEARFGQIRGTSAELTSVTLNGNRIPSAEGDTRNVQLDLIPSDMVQTIEVNKVVTPDMDGDAIGGSINLVTKHSPFRRTLNMTAGSGYNWVSRKAQLNLGLTYGDRFFGDRLGMMLSASYQNAPSGSYNTEFAWEQGENGNAYINDYQIRQYYVTRERQSYSAAFDYKFNANHTLTFDAVFNNRNDWENRYRVTLKDLDEDGNGTVRVQTKAGSSNHRDARLERQRTLDLTLGGKHLLGSVEADWSANYASASEKRPNERYVDLQLKKQQFDIDISDEREPVATPLAGSTMTLSDDFSLKEITQQQEDIKEKDVKFAANFKAPLGIDSKLRFGGKVVRKTKEKEVDYYEYSPVDEDAFMEQLMANTTDKSTSRFMPGSKYQTGTFVSKQFIGSLDLDDASLFEKEQVAEELAGNYKALETVSSGYVRLDTKLTQDIKLMAGLRVEHTHLGYTGRDYDDETDIVTKTPRETNDYTDFLPSLLTKWDVSDDLKLRASYTRTLSRPKYSDLVPGMKVSTSDNEASIGNSDLSPTHSDNLDFNAEYYFKSVGLVSAGVFYKGISDFIVDEVLTNYEYNGTTYTRFTQPKNAGDARLWGLEFSYRRDFGFICPALRTVGLYGTYTYTHSRVYNFNFEGRENESGLSMPGSPAHTGNVSLYYEDKGVSVRLSYNCASSFIDEMGESKFYDRYYDKVNYLDLNASYMMGKKVKTTFYAEVTNLLNQPLRYYQGTEDRTMQAEYYGVKFNAGVKINL